MTTSIEDLALTVRLEEHRLEQVARDHGLTVKQVLLAERIGMAPAAYAAWAGVAHESPEHDAGEQQQTTSEPSDLVFVGCYLPQELRDIVDAVARRHGHSRSDAIRAALVEYARSHIGPLGA